MKFYFFILVMIIGSQVLASDQKQFPEDGKVYIPGVDSGFAQYEAKSLFQTKTVALTFDDGPDINQTPRLLDILKKYNVKATFFILTEKLNNKTKPIVKRIIEEGHIIASHHHDHENNNAKTEDSYREGLKKSVKVIAQLLEELKAPNKEIYYRFPYGAYGSKSTAYHHFNIMKEVSQELFGDNCINFVFWDIDSLDWLKPMNQSDVESNIMANLIGGTAYNLKKKFFSGKLTKTPYNIIHPMGGGIILMHDIHSRSVDTVGPLLERFRAEGIQVKPLNEIEEYSFKGKECRLKN